MVENDAIQKATWDRWTRSVIWQERFRYTEWSKIRVIRAALEAYRQTGGTPPRVLDYGFGAGYSLFYFDRKTPIYGVEMSGKAVQSAANIAREKGFTDFHFSGPCAYDSLKIEYPDSFFDIVICSHVIEHASDDERLLSELYRVLKVGGAAFLLVPLDAAHTNLMENKEDRKNANYPLNSFHVWIYNIETFHRLVTKAGFKVIEKRALDSAMQWLQHLRSRSRFLQIVASAVLVLLPWPVWGAFDRACLLRGYRPMQGMVVANK